MPRRNNRMAVEYNDRLGFNARKYINTVTYGRRNADQWPGTSTPYRGDVWFAQLGFTPGTCTTAGRHPVLVISNNENNFRNEIITVIPITSNTSRLYLPTQISIRATEMARLQDDFDFEDGALLLDQITTIDKALLRDYIGRVQADKIEEVESALRRQLGMGS